MKFLLLVCTLSVFSLFKVTNLSSYTDTKSTTNPLSEIKTNYIENFSNLHTDLKELNSVVEDFKQNRISEEKVKEQFLKCRTSYKRVEYLIEFLDPYLVAKSINGAPLPKLEPKVPEVVVIDPNGLQTIDELIFSDELKENVGEIMTLTDKLTHTIEKTIKYQNANKLQHRYIIESMRYQLIRVYTLGLTGFDTPGSVNAMADAETVFQTLITDFKTYSLLAKSKGARTYSEIIKLLEKGHEILKGNVDYETFDRLDFLTEIINPLFASLRDFQLEMNIEGASETDPTLGALNLNAQNLYDKNIYNKSFYTKVADSDLDEKKKIELGKLMFYDPILSKDLNMACSSCHNPEKAFTDGLKTSKGNQEGFHTLRNSPTLVNSAYSSRFFWDLREYDLERQIKHVMFDTIEFNMDFLDLADRLKESKEYYDLFEDAYKGRDRYVISTWSISNAIAAYISSLNGLDSEFDKYVRGETESVSESIKNGHNIFMGKAACGTCHFAPMFNGNVPPLYQDSESEVLGVPVEYGVAEAVLDNDIGRLGNGLPSEEAEHFARSFKTVTVRNASVTAPYMHNGSINTLEELMKFYNEGGGLGMGLDVPHQTLPEDHLNLTENEISDVIEFINSLESYKHLIPYEDIQLPSFEGHPEWNERKPIML